MLDAVTSPTVAVIVNRIHRQFFGLRHHHSRHGLVDEQAGARQMGRRVGGVDLVPAPGSGAPLRFALVLRYGRRVRGEQPPTARRPGQAENPALRRAGRSGLLVPRHPQAPATPRNPRGHPAVLRPDRPPPSVWPPRWPPARLRPRGLQAAEHPRRVHQPLQAVAPPGHANRRTRHRLPGRTRRWHPHLDPTPAKETEPAGRPTGTLRAVLRVRGSDAASRPGPLRAAPARCWWPCWPDRSRVVRSWRRCCGRAWVLEPDRRPDRAAPAQ